MATVVTDEVGPSSERRNVLLGAVFLCFAIVAMTCFSAWNFDRLVDDQARDQAIQMAHLSISKDLNLRAWVASLGGIYAPVTRTTQPNPWLQLQNRDFTLPNGQQITKINPAYAYRLVQERWQKDNSGRGRLVSLRPIRHQNSADAWEAKAINELTANNGIEKIEEEHIDGIRRIRLLRILRAESSCLICHAAHGYKEGDVLGGLSVIPPLDDVGPAYRDLGNKIILFHALVALLCLATVIFFTMRLLKNIRQREKATGQLRELLANMDLQIDERTRQLQASEKAHDNERLLLRYVVKAAPACMILCDTENNILTCNQGAQIQLGLCVGGTCKNIWEDLPAFETLCHRVLEGESFYKTPVSIRNHVDREQRFHMLLTSCSITYNGAMTILYWLQDITEQMTLQLAAESSARSKSAFLAQMSHEIRTPLNAIIGMSQLAGNHIQNTEKTKAALGQINASSRHLLGILNDILDISKIENDKMQLALMPDKLSAIYADAGIIIKNSCKEKQISYSEHTDTLPDIQIVFDKLRLNQILINLLGNAVKFTPSGGRVSFSLRVIKENAAFITLAFRIEDSGIGMSQEQLERIFIPFEQADTATSRKFGGTGLGLSISQKLVCMMGGEIAVESAPDQGSVFSFELTFAKSNIDIEQKEEDESCTNDLQGIDLHGKNILLVEDVLINREIVKEILADTGANVVEASDGSEALEAFHSSGEGFFDLIFMDIQMPQVDGYEATKLIRAMPGSYATEIPIVAMTANAFTEDVDAALSCGMTAHLSKPLEFGRLRQILKKYLLKAPDGRAVP